MCDEELAARALAEAVAIAQQSSQTLPPPPHLWNPLRGPDHGLRASAKQQAALVAAYCQFCSQSLPPDEGAASCLEQRLCCCLDSSHLRILFRHSGFAQSQCLQRLKIKLSRDVATHHALIRSCTLQCPLAQRIEIECCDCVHVHASACASRVGFKPQKALCCGRSTKVLHCGC